MKPAQAQQQLPELMRLFQSGRLAEARALGRRMNNAIPRQPQVLAMLGAIHGQLGEFREAENCYRALVSLEPAAHTYHYYLALALVMQQRLQEAVPVLARMLQLRPDFAEGHMQMGCLLRDLGQHDAATNHFERALQLSPGLTDAAVFLGNLRVFQGRMDDALRCYEQALSYRPGDPDAIAGKALILERQGDKDAAWALLQTVVAQGRATPNIAIAYALLAPTFAATDQAKALLQGLLARGGLAPSQQQELYFALGRLCDKIGDFDTAFVHYAAGNRLTQTSFDVPALRAKTERIKQVFSRPDVLTVDVTSMIAPIPIFIVGMPRSGTSLVEQILASHPEVAAGGELEVLPEIERAAGEMLGRSEPYPECLVGVSAADMARLAERYRTAITGIAQESGGARYVTDKLPPNYERLGLIQRLFPEARIVHAQRDPRDTCLSCFFQNFGNTHTYSTDLRVLGEVYGIYRDLMTHWRATQSLPIMDIAYESIVAEPEASVRRLLEFCGLSWHDDCLNFHASKRYVNTASYDQVRQPLYDSSVGRWRHYERHLAELLEALPKESI
ncbi:MAG: sulfotransferase [Gammaproteobacteria bacterium]|nr:sulfotransferase [Gammaproteobacteria bacterium]